MSEELTRNQEAEEQQEESGGGMPLDSGESEGITLQRKDWQYPGEMGSRLLGASTRFIRPTYNSCLGRSA